MERVTDDTLHFLACGHVDDGKSTLIGRLLYELDAVPDDQVQGAMVDGRIDYARLTDGLEDERAQGITIDVAYRYFRHRGRSYRIADTPGHVQYTRNMAVAAVGTDVALILIDASHGVREQTLRHSRIAAMLGIRQLVIVVNKMDLVAYAHETFDDIVAVYARAMADAADTELSLTFIPVCAMDGDNVVTRSERMPWYDGPTLQGFLEAAKPRPQPRNGVRLPVQAMIKIGEARGYLGRLSGGGVAVGDRLKVAGSGQLLTVAQLYHSGKAVDDVDAGQAVTLVPAEDIDISRGSLLLPVDDAISPGDAIMAHIIWVDDSYASQTTASAILKVHTHEVFAEVEVVRSATADNPVVDAKLFAASALPVDAYASNPETGLFLLIDPETEATIGVGIVTLAMAASPNYSI